MANAWYYTRGGKKEGPVSSQELKHLAESGQLQPTDQVWKDGMAQGVPASKIKGVFPSSQAEVGSQPSPPPLPGSPAGTAKPAQPAKKRIYKWVGLGIGAVIILAVIANAGKKDSGGGGGKGPKGEAAKIGDEITFKDSKWTVVTAKDHGTQIRPNNQFLQPAKTEGRFILVHFKVTNLTNQEDRILNTPKLIDSKGREFKDYDQQSMYIPEGAKTLTVEALPAGMTKEFWALYEVPADATDLKFQARALSAFGDKKMVDLGL